MAFLKVMKSILSGSGLLFQYFVVVEKPYILVLGVYIPISFKETLEVLEIKQLMKNTVQQISNAIAHLV